MAALPRSDRPRPPHGQGLRRPRADAARPRGQGIGRTSPEVGQVRTDPPENAIYAMLLLTAIAIGLVLFVECIAKGLR